MGKKYELTEEKKMVGGHTLYRIKALRSFRSVEEGELGGFVEKEENLSHDGDSWVCGNTRVYGGAMVCGDAVVYGNARVCGGARVKTNDDLCLFSYFGSENRSTTAYKTAYGGIGVVCGCFCGSLQEFRDRVEKVHGADKYGGQYRLIARLIELKLNNTRQ